MLDLVDQIPLTKAKAQIKNVPEEIKLVLARDFTIEIVKHHLNKLPIQQQKEALALLTESYMRNWVDQKDTDSRLD